MLEASGQVLGFWKGQTGDQVALGTASWSSEVFGAGHLREGEATGKGGF